MEVKPSKKALLVWFFEKGPFLTIITIYCMYLVFTSIDSLPYVYNSEPTVISFTISLAALSLLSLVYEYRTKKYYILESQIHIKKPFGVDRAKFNEIKDIKVIKSPLHKAMKVGDILVKSKKKSLAIECVEKPERIERAIHKKVSKEISSH